MGRDCGGGADCEGDAPFAVAINRMSGGRLRRVRRRAALFFLWQTLARPRPDVKCGKPYFSTSLRSALAVDAASFDPSRTSGVILSI